MRIGIDCRYAEGNLTGIGSYLLGLSKKLAEAGNKVYLLYSRIPTNRIEEDNITSIILRTNNEYYFEQILIPQFLSKERVDLYHAAGNVGISRFVSCPSVLTVHDIIPILIHDYFDKSKFSILSSLSYKFRLISSLIFSKKIISVSNFTRKCLVDKIKIDHEKIKVIGQGVDVDKSKIKKAFYSNSDYIVCNSGISERKNLKRLILSFKEAMNSFPDYKLFITGENRNLEKELCELVKILEIERSVVFTGFIKKEELYSLVSGAKLVCNVSEIEGFGVPLLEAFSLGIPVVCSNISSFKEVAGESAVFVDPHDIGEIARGMISLIKNSKKRDALVALGHDQLKKYSWEKIIKSIIEVYREVSR